MSREEKKRAAKRAERAADRRDELRMRAAYQLQLMHEQNTALQGRIDYYRNIFVSSAFAAGLGNERPLTELVKEAHPLLLGNAVSP